MIDKANEMCDLIVQMLQDKGMSTDIVNNNVDEDSVCEHVIDVDVVHDDYIWNVHIDVVRFYKTGPYAKTMEQADE